MMRKELSYRVLTNRISLAALLMGVIQGIYNFVISNSFSSAFLGFTEGTAIFLFVSLLYSNIRKSIFIDKWIFSVTLGIVTYLIYSFIPQMPQEAAAFFLFSKFGTSLFTLYLVDWWVRR